MAVVRMGTARTRGAVEHGPRWENGRVRPIGVVKQAGFVDELGDAAHANIRGHGGLVANLVLDRTRQQFALGGDDHAAARIGANAFTTSEFRRHATGFGRIASSAIIAAVAPARQRPAAASSARYERYNAQNQQPFHGHHLR